MWKRALRDVEDNSYCPEEEPLFVALQYDSSSKSEDFLIVPIVAEPHAEQAHNKIVNS